MCNCTSILAESAGERLQSVQKEYAKRVIPWVGMWARKTAIKVWGTSPEVVSDPAVSAPRNLD